MNGRHYQRYLQSIHPLLQAIEPDDLDTLLEGTGISVRDLYDRDKLISRTQELAVFRNVIRQPEYSGLAMTIGLAITPTAMGAVGYAQLACRTAREAIELCKRYRCLTMPYMRWDVLVIGSEVVHRITDTDKLGELRPFIMELTLAMIASQTWELVGTECQPTALSFSYEEPKYSEYYNECFGIKPRFGQRTTELRFPVEYLDLERRDHDPVMKASLEQLCRHMASRVMWEPSIGQEVLNVLRASGDILPGVEQLACHFGLSARTLRRRLQEDHSGYRILIDQVRRERAMKYLHDRELALPIVAERCGFIELHSFYSAFKRWTDSTPAAYRSQLTAYSV
jgi:AraC-like DNA-binding protein